ncbi:LuxR C-terminal-related transcriptional regulator [Actinokineospora sp. PR83]|uniref:helix-turn-helix transcriptional regulator n=1 Tax=Actinokineospora sp. PR83 TaxID=2884908 RepID=UPI001F3E542F|nr:LuxR C-terminal-related transcriptional regulator [Actinokineospora sp. PR83]MCG8916564.1 LuxR C-terminal-related transcriptional regulator [Actinokineospora sp. PR83]
MTAGGWAEPRRVLVAAKEVMRAPLRQVLGTLSEVIADFLPHTALVMLSGDCPKTPMWAHGDAALVNEVTTVEMTRLSTLVDVGTPWVGEATLAGSPRPVLALAAAPPGSAGALLAVLTTGDGDHPAAALAVVQELWELVAGRILDLLPAAVPVTTPWIANSERARVIAGLTDAHAATLMALLGVLRSRALDDRTARRTAIDLLASAMVELRATDDDDPAPHEETIGDAYGRLSDMLGLLSRYGDVALDFSPVDGRNRLIPADIARTARAVIRGTVLTMLEQGGVSRIRVGWEVDDTGLLCTVRDDGPGALAAEALAVHRLTDRVVAHNGSLHLDSVPEWGTIVTMRLPLAAPGLSRGEQPLTVLNPRELDVLEHLVNGHRNRVIAEHLHISEHTVKFHVAKILKKLGVDSRGEAAAVARAAGFPVEPWLVGQPNLPVQAAWSAPSRSTS